MRAPYIIEIVADEVQSSQREEYPSARLTFTRWTEARNYFVFYIPSCLTVKCSPASVPYFYFFLVVLKLCLTMTSFWFTRSCMVLLNSCTGKSTIICNHLVSEVSQLQLKGTKLCIIHDKLFNIYKHVARMLGLYYYWLALPSLSLYTHKIYLT